ncbi:hypothetical protein RJT34_07676 [Clitoria ternatea]|uniref:Uncharacterized protein n=1 Tax=Clitoria ternatea TaxID=43366 RepID=A0AAN9K4Q2_CLITE
MFVRSVVCSACVRTGEPSSTLTRKKELADELREKVLLSPYLSDILIQVNKIHQTWQGTGELFGAVVMSVKRIVEEYTRGSTKPYGVKEMTFLKEDEVFLTITIPDASENIEDDSKASVSADSLKDETNEVINTNVEADKKRKLSDKPTEKKVLPLFQSCLYQWFHPDSFLYPCCFNLKFSTMEDK